MDENKNYWLYIESFVFSSKNDHEALLYNHLTNEHFLFRLDNDLSQLLDDLLLPENMYCISVSEKQLQHSSIAGFLQVIRDKYWGDLLRSHDCSHKPIVFTPLLNFQKQKDRADNGYYYSTGDNVMELLQEITVNIDTTNIQSATGNEILPVELLISLISQLSGSANRGIVISGNIWKYPYLSTLLGLLPNLQGNKSFIFQYQHTDSRNLSDLKQIDATWKVLVNLPINNHEWEAAFSVLSAAFNDIDIKFIFEITSNESCQLAEAIINKYRIEHYELRPLYTGNNLRFFEDNIFLSKEDILAAPVSAREIYMHQVLNTFDFGKIVIFPDGKVYANVNQPLLGNISDQSIQEMLHKEMDKGNSWLRIRDQAPCKSCVYRWLCPSPSDYEIIIGKPNLCHVASERSIR